MEQRQSLSPPLRSYSLHHRARRCRSNRSPSRDPEFMRPSTRHPSASPSLSRQSSRHSFYSRRRTSKKKCTRSQLLKFKAIMRRVRRAQHRLVRRQNEIMATMHAMLGAMKKVDRSVIEAVADVKRALKSRGSASSKAMVNNSVARPDRDESAASSTFQSESD